MASRSGITTDIDVLVIGRAIYGLSAAVTARQAGAQVFLLERLRPVFGRIAAGHATLARRQT